MMKLPLLLLAVDAEALGLTEKMHDVMRGVKAAVHGGKFVSPLNLKQRRKLQDTCSLKDITRLVCYFSSDTCSDMLVVRREKILCPEIESLPRYIARP